MITGSQTSSPVIAMYKKLLDDGIITMEQVPEDLREEVLLFKMPPAEEGIPDDPEPTNSMIIKSMHFNYAPVIRVQMNPVFSVSAPGKPKPEDVSYTIRRVENSYGKFSRFIGVNLIPTETGFDLHINGETQNLIPNCHILRIDIIINSTNYEPTPMTIYIDNGDE